MVITSAGELVKLAVKMTLASAKPVITGALRARLGGHAAAEQPVRHLTGGQRTGEGGQVGEGTEEAGLDRTNRLYLREGAVRRNVVHYCLGTWLALVSILALSLGAPGLFWMVTIAGGGGYVVAAVLEHRRLAPVR